MGTALCERRKEWLLSSLVSKLVSRGTKPTLRLCLERAFRKFDANHSGSLDGEEFRQAMEDQLPGIDEDEIAALAAFFDADGDGTVSIDEFVGALIARAADGAAPPAGADRVSSSSSSSPPLRRQTVSGVARRRAEEFVDDGYNQKNVETDDFDGVLREVRRRAEEIGGGESSALVRRALERHKSTRAAKHLTRGQFEAALTHFVVVDDAQLVERLWKKCNGGECDAFLAMCERRAGQRADDASPSSSSSSSSKNPLSKTELATLRLKHLLLDKIEASGGAPFRITLKRLLDKYDADRSGQLDRAECERAFRDMLPGITPHQIACLVDDFDADRSGTVDVAELEAALRGAHQARAPEGTTIAMPRKQPLWTKAGARGL